MATTYIVYVSKSVRKTLLGGKIGVRLIRLLVDWAKAQQVQEIHIIATAALNLSTLTPLFDAWVLSRMAGTMWWGCENSA